MTHYLIKLHIWNFTLGGKKIKNKDYTEEGFRKKKYIKTILDCGNKMEIMKEITKKLGGTIQ